MCKALAPGIVLKSVDHYQENRQFLLNNLKKRGMGKSGLEPLILNEVDQLIAHLSNIPVIDPSRVLGNYTSNNFMMICFSKRWNYDDPQYDLFHNSVVRNVKIASILTLGDMVPALNYLPPMRKLQDECFKLVGNIRNYYEDFIDEKLKNEETSDGFDIVSDYLRVKKDFNDKERENLLDICQDLFIAGTDTTAATLGYILIHLMNHPNIQEELYNELDTVLQGRDPAMLDLQNLPLMEATIWEGLRVNPNAPLVMHATKEAAALRSYTIPANTMVLINVYSINHDPQHFPDPEKFNPHRWISPEGNFRSELVELTATFGMGRRVCPGRPLAKMEMFLVQAFKITVPEGEPKPDGFMKGSGVIVSPDPYIMKLKRRHESEETYM